MDRNGQKVATDFPEGRSNRNKCTEGWGMGVGVGCGVYRKWPESDLQSESECRVLKVSKRSEGVWEP